MPNYILCKFAKMLSSQHTYAKEKKTAAFPVTVIFLKRIEFQNVFRLLFQGKKEELPDSDSEVFIEELVTSKRDFVIETNNCCKQQECKVR